MGDLLEACIEATGSGLRLRSGDAATLTAAGVEPWTDLPAVGLRPDREAAILAAL